MRKLHMVQQLHGSGALHYCEHSICFSTSRKKTDVEQVRYVTISDGCLTAALLAGAAYPREFFIVLRPCGSIHVHIGVL